MHLSLSVARKYVLNKKVSLLYGTNYKKIDAIVRSSVRFSPVVYVWAPDETSVSSLREFAFH